MNTQNKWNINQSDIETKYMDAKGKGGSGMKLGD